MKTKNNHKHKRRHPARYDQRMSETVGLPPGTLVHVGEKKAEQAVITVMNYNENDYTENIIKNFEDYKVHQKENSVTWIDIDGLHQIGILEQAGECFNIHPLVLEDILNTNQRPKMEDFGDYIYIVFKMLYYHDNGNGNEFMTEQVSLILGENYVISFQEKHGDVFDIIRDRIRHLKGRVRRMGADYLAYALMDAAVDHYFIILETLGETIENQEEEMISNPTMAILEKIHELRGEMLMLRRSVWPLREAVGGLERGESPRIQSSTAVFFRDLYDHTIQIIDTIETYREILASMMDIYLSSTSNRLNEIMKVLTIISTLFIPLTFLVGVYGTNFKYLPELEWRWSYPLLWTVMISIWISMLLYFKKKKWF